MKKYPLFKVHVDKAEALQSISEVFDSGFINEGVQVTALTRELSAYLETDRLLLTNSCTSAITLALVLSGVGHGDIVVSTPMTCVASNTPIVTLGAKIKWADIDADTGMIDPTSVSITLESLIKAGTPAKAVIAVAWAGTPPELEQLLTVCEKYGAKLILDAAHAFDARWRKSTDSASVDQIFWWAHFTCYSFQAIKHFTTGDGGALVCNDEDDFQRAKSLKWFGLDRDNAKDAKGDWKGQQWDTDIVEAGYKFNMNNVSAAIGLSQLKHIPKIIGAHRANATLYDAAFKDVDVLSPLLKPRGVVSSHWVYTVRLSASTKIGRNDLVKQLNDEGIMAGLVHVPNDLYTAFSGFREENLKGVRGFSETQFSLPCGWWLTRIDVLHIAKRVLELTS